MNKEEVKELAQHLLNVSKIDVSEECKILCIEQMICERFGEYIECDNEEGVTSER